MGKERIEPDRGKVMNAYFCSTYYHVLISVLKSLKSGRKDDIYILSYINNGLELVSRLNNSRIFNQAVYLAEPDFEKSRKIIHILIWKYYTKWHYTKERGYNFSSYTNLYLYMDDTYIARYFKVSGIKYHLIEDSLDAFKHILNNVYSRMVKPSKDKYYYLYKLFPAAMGNYNYFLDSECVQSIEVNDRKGIIFDNDPRIIEIPRKQLYEQLEDKSKLNRVCNIFLEDTSILAGDNIAIIFTSPFYDDKLLQSEKEQIRLYCWLVRKYEGEYSVLIKPHPRDIVNYSAIGNVSVLPRSFPSELIKYIGFDKVSKYISIASHSVDIYPVEKVDFYEFEDAIKAIQ